MNSNHLAGTEYKLQSGFLWSMTAFRLVFSQRLITSVIEYSVVFPLVCCLEEHNRKRPSLLKSFSFQLVFCKTKKKQPVLMVLNYIPINMYMCNTSKQADTPKEFHPSAQRQHQATWAEKLLCHSVAGTIATTDFSGLASEERSRICLITRQHP